jgi:uncharacterized protein
MFFLIYTLVGIISGLLMVFFGFGGGLFSVPAMFIGLRFLDLPAGITMHVAVGTSLLVMFFNGMSATLQHHKRGSIQWPLVKMLLPYIAIGAVFGIMIAVRLHSDVLRYLFILYITITIAKTIKQNRYAKQSHVNSNQHQQHHDLHPVKTAAVGLGAGLVATLLGMGGSLFTVPFFRSYRIPMHQAVAMASALTLPVSIIGTIGYIISGWHRVHLAGSLGFVYWPVALCMVAGGLIGIFLGTQWVYRLPEHHLARIYLSVLVIVLLIMLM